MADTQPAGGMPCYCGHDCARCRTRHATLTGDDALRREIAAWYRAEFGQDRPPEAYTCYGGRTGRVMEACRQCPYRRCCREKGLAACADCADYPCGMLAWYLEKYVNQCNQV